MAILFTKSGYEDLKVKLKEAEEKRPEVLESLVRAREMGDLSENGAYKSAKFELNNLDRKIRHLKHLVREGQVIQPPTNNKTIQIGHTVILRRIS